MNLIEAAKHGDTDTIKLLLDRGADINATDKYGWTALMYASQCSNRTSSLETVKLLLDRGADVNATDKYGWTALMRASYFSNNGRSLDTVRLLLDGGADINVKNKYGETALMRASLFGNDMSSLDAVRLLLDQGADINITNNYGFTALMLASQSSNSTSTSSLETVRLLLDCGADPYPALDNCPTNECRKLIASYIALRLLKTINLEADKYKGDISRDVWKIILLKRRQQQLCKDLSSDKNKYILLGLAKSLEIPVTDTITKEMVCNLISQHLIK